MATTQRRLLILDDPSVAPEALARSLATLGHGIVQIVPLPDEPPPDDPHLAPEARVRELERRLAEEQAARKAAEEFRLLVDRIKDYAVFLLDPEGHVASWNEGARSIKGYAPSEILGRHFSVFYPSEEVAARRPQAGLELALREGRAEFEGWRLRKDGSRFWANVVITPIHDDDGVLHGFGKVTRDLSERKQAEEQRERLVHDLEDALQARDEFLQIASHELKTPLTPLQLQLEMLARALARAGCENDRLTTQLQTATRQTQRLGRLVQGLLDVSRITSGRVSLELETLDLAELVRDLVARFGVEAERQGSEITTHVPDALVGRWDRMRIEQILSNLISNAIKYGGGKPIGIDLTQLDDDVRLAVTDNGIGVDPEELSRIFGRFERAVSARHLGGLGLGLFIARQFAEAHGGALGAHSQPGMGSTFTLTLPLEARPPALNEVERPGWRV